MFRRSARGQSEAEPAKQDSGVPKGTRVPNAGHIEVFAGITVATTMLQELILRDYIEHIRTDLGKPENRTGRLSNAKEQTRLLDCAWTGAWSDPEDLSWVFELEGMDLIGYKLAIHDLLPTILAYANTQRLAIKSLELKRAAEASTGFQGEVLKSMFDLNANAFKTLEHRQRDR